MIPFASRILLFVFLITLSSFPDTNAQTCYKNSAELSYFTMRGMGVSYSHSLFPHAYLDFYFGYEHIPLPSRAPAIVNTVPERNDFITGIGFQHRVVPFGIWDFSLLYSLRERISWGRYPDAGTAPRKDDEYTYCTGIWLLPKLRVHFLQRLFAYAGAAPVFEISVRKTSAPLMPLALKINYYFLAEGIAGIGCDF